MTHTQEEMSAAFEKASNALPDVVGGQTLVSMGTFGLVLAGENDDITKVLFRHSEPYWNGLSEEHSSNEIAALLHFSANPLKTLGTPVLIDEPQNLDHDDYKSYYKMTRLPGRSMSWHPENDGATEQKRLAREGALAGRTLAQFHRDTLAIPPNTFNDANPIKYGHIRRVQSLPEFMNAALAEADKYLQENKPMGIVHGDFHGGNIMATSDRTVSGLIDFGFTGYANLYYDFIKAKPYFMPGLIEGYEMESGQPVDQKLIAATTLGRYSSRLAKLEKDHPIEGLDSNNPERIKVIGTIVGCLEDMGIISGP